MFIGGSKYPLQRVLESESRSRFETGRWFKAGGYRSLNSFAVTVALLSRRSQSKQAEKFVLLQRDGNSDDLSLLEDQTRVCPQHQSSTEVAEFELLEPDVCFNGGLLIYVLKYQHISSMSHCQILMSGC